MSGPSLTQVFGGPAIITYRGSTFYSKGDILVDVAPSTFDIETDAYGKVDERVKTQPMKIRFTPAGKWGDLGVLYDYSNSLLGDLITPVRTLGIVVGNLVTAYNHGLTSGDAGYVTNVGGNLPTGLTSGVLYYVYAASGDAISFHTNRADALVGTNKISITNNGTGVNRLACNNPLVIQTLDPSNPEQITFWNAAVTRMPNINCTATATLLEEVEFEAFLRDGTAASDLTTPYYAVTKSAFAGDTSFNPVNILTQPIVASWGASAPWSSFYTKAGVKIDFSLSLQDVDIDGYGIVSKRISNLVVTARLQPLGLDVNDLFNALQLQGAGAGIGRSLGQNGNNLNLSSTGFYARLYQAGIKGGPELFSRSKERIGEVQFVATLSFNAGRPNQLFWVGSTALS